MDWDKLRIFHAVAKAGSFTHAGEALNLSQSAVSRQISTLEESIHVVLFHRHARGLILTEEGEILYNTADEIFAKMAMIEGRLADSKQLAEGPLRITAAPFIGSTWLAPRLKNLKNSHPDVQLTLLLDDRLLNLSMREADAAIRLYESEQPDLIQRHLTDIHFHICASEEYLKKNGIPETVKDLKNHTMIGYPEGVPPPFADPNWLFRASGLEMDSSPNLLMMNSLYGIYEAVKAGTGIAALPDYLISDSKLRLILPAVTRPPVGMYFVYPEERKNSQRIAAFRDFLLKTISETDF